MKPNALAISIAITLCATLAIPVESVAQDAMAPTNKPKYYRYKLVDIGLGGPQSAVFEFAHTLTDRGAVVGMAETSTPDPNYPNFSPFVGFGNPDHFIQHGFLWRDGVVTDLGALTNSSQVAAINASGVAVGVSENGVIDPLNRLLAVHAVVWNDGHIIDLGTLEGGYESLASDTDNGGQVVGASQNAISDPFGYGGVQTRAVLWQQGAIRDLGTLGTGNDAIAQFVNARGQVAGWSYTNSTPNPATGIPTQDPYLWHHGTMLDLGTLGGTAGVPNALNSRGLVVGVSDVAGDLSGHPFLWNKPGPMQDLGTFGGTFGEATWVNDAGEVIGQATLPGDQVSHAFFWKDGVKTDLGTLDGDSSSVAHGLNSKRQVVGSSTNGNGATRGFLWENGKMFDLNTLISASSKLNLYFPTFINDRGEIDGQGQLPNGDIHAFVLIPCEGDLSDDEGCEESAEGITAIQNNSVPVTLSPADLTEVGLKPTEIADRVGDRFGRNHGRGPWLRKIDSLNIYPKRDRR
jgi:probable HAF family extracellular repeat protein